MAEEAVVESVPETLETPHPSATSPTDSPTAVASDPSLSRNASFSKLNARAPEFVPSKPPPPPATPSPPLPSRLAVMPPPPGAAMMHMYSPAPSPPLPTAGPTPPYHVPIHSPVPVAHVIPVHQHHHPRHHQQPPPPPPQYVAVRNHNNHHQHHHQQFGQNAHYVPVQGHGNQEHHQNHHYAKKLQQQSEEGEQNEVGPADYGRSKNQKTDKNGLSDEAMQKLLNQVEYYFSDLNLATTDHLMRFISKDPDGYVPLSVVSSFKKVKAAVDSHSQLANILRNSLKLIVSEDGKRVKRQQPFTEPDMEELQSRIIVAENLPEDHCHQNLMKIFSSVGSVRTIRTCPPQNSGAGPAAGSRSTKADGMHFTNKLHAFVEYDSVEIAEKAVMELNEEANWRNGLRVRLMLKRPGRGKKDVDGPGQSEEEEACTSEQQSDEKPIEDLPKQQPDVQVNGHPGDDNLNNDKDAVQRKGRGRGGRGKGRGRGHSHHHNPGRGGNHIGGPPPSSNAAATCEHTVKQPPPPGPRMPDGTRGFAMGRGKPVPVNTT
ncbi:unnamed protein product [Linum tenue]|uniref:La-related protein 6B n=1 Tax=Linum tenue TaxID=586396 RepID=A0AAV0Q8A2_9ROSI|nr:unnamed protein product [Linum tenue]